LKSKAKAVVIGGGVVGASTLYHLASKGWNDSILIERKMLTYAKELKFEEAALLRDKLNELEKIIDEK